MKVLLFSYGSSRSVCGLTVGRLLQVNKKATGKQFFERVEKPEKQLACVDVIAISENIDIAETESDEPINVDEEQPQFRELNRDVYIWKQLSVTF